MGKQYYTVEFEVDDQEVGIRNQTELEDFLCTWLVVKGIRVASPERGVLKPAAIRDFVRAIVPIMRARRGQYRQLENHIEHMPMAVQRELMQLLRNMEDEIHDAKRTFRPFPGGPKIRI